MPLPSPMILDALGGLLANPEESSSTLESSPEAIAKASLHALLVLQIVAAGPAVWNPLASTCPQDQADSLRQQLDALRDQLVLAGFDADEAAVRPLIERLRSSRLAADAPADESVTRFLELQSLEKQSLAVEIVRYFLFRELRAKCKLRFSSADDGPLVWNDLELVASLLGEHEADWTTRLDRPLSVTTSAPVEHVAHVHLERGRQSVERGEYREAITHLTAGLKLDSVHGELYQLRGDAYRLLGEARRAISDYHVALRLRPGFLPGLIGRAVAFWISGDLERAAADANAALEVSHDQSLALRIRAATRYERRDLDGALADLDRALDLDSDDLESHRLRGKILVERGDYHDAVRDFDEILNANPHNVQALLERGHAYRGLGDYGRAIRDYSDVLRHQPGQAAALSARGLAHDANGDKEQALRDYTEAFRLEPTNVSTLFQRAKLHRLAGDHAAALADLDDVLARQPEHFAALYHRAKIGMAKGQWQSAIDDLGTTLKLNPCLAAGFASRAIALDRLGNHAEAHQDATRAIELEPISATLHVIRGRTSVNRRDLVAAIEDFSNAIRHDDGFPLAFQERSFACTLNGDYDEALDDIDRVLELEPGNAQAYAHRSILYHLRGNLQAALIDYTRALQLDPRVLVAGWNQPLADYSRTKTSQLLADAIDGRRFRRNLPSAAPTLEWSITVKHVDEPDVKDIPPVAKVAAESVKAAPRIVVSPPKPASAVESPLPETSPEPILDFVAPKADPGEDATSEPSADVSISTAPTLSDATAPNASALQETATHPVTPAPTTTAAPLTKLTSSKPAPNASTPPVSQKSKPNPKTATSIEHLVVEPTVTEPVKPAIAKPTSAKPRSVPAPKTSTSKATAVKQPVAEEVDLEPIDDDVTVAPIAFDENVDAAIEALLASGPAVEAVESPTPSAKSATRPAPNPSPNPSPSPTAGLPAFDCPLCKHRVPAAEVLSGGRIRCGGCNAIFFPKAESKPFSPSPATTPAKASPIKPAPKPANRRATAKDESDEGSLLEKWKRPLPIGGTAVAILALIYFYLPSSLFGGAGRQVPVFPARGEISFEGKAIPNATIVLLPVDGKTDAPNPKATVGPDGTFVLGTYDRDDGAPAGEYKAAIQWFPPPTAKDIREDNYVPRNQLPPRFARPDTSGVTITIQSGDTEIPAIRLKR